MEQTNGNIIKILVQGGLAGALILSLFIMWNIITNHYHDIGDHINKNTEVLTELKMSIERSNDIGEEQSDLLRGLQRLIELKL